MHQYLLTIILGLGLAALGRHLLVGRPVAAETKDSSVVFNADGTVNQPDPHVFRRWVFVGAPLTPEGLNNGKFNCDQLGGCTKSNFPEYHHVYIEQQNVDAYLKTGDFPEGTVVVKELTRVLDPASLDGCRTETSLCDYFIGTYIGIALSIHVRQKYENTNGSLYFNSWHD